MKAGQRKAVQPFLRRGWTVEYRSKHVALRCPCCSFFQPLSANVESEWHAMKNLRRQIERHEEGHTAHGVDR